MGSEAGLLSSEHKSQLSEKIGEPDFFGGRYYVGSRYRRSRYRPTLIRVEGT